MPRTLDIVLQATLVMAVIVLSPYAMFATKGCREGSGGGTEGGGAGDRTVAADPPGPGPAGPEPTDAGTAPDAADGDASPECIFPDVEIVRSEGCDSGEPYPSCRYGVAEPRGEDPYEIWRYTKPSHLWGRPALVTLVLSAAGRYAALHPGERITIGDLDAPGDRHRTHEEGVDADLYLPGTMAGENMGKGRLRDNYAGRSPSFVDKCRSRVLDLARILATCASGRIRIYYNDPPLADAFIEWFGARGLTSPFGDPMQPHNELHRFHFHITIPEDLPPLT